MGNWEWITQDGLVFGGEGKIWGLGIVATAGGVATASFYDGRDTSGKLLATLSTPAGETRFIPLPQPFKVLQGLYVSLGANVQGVILLWEASHA